MNKVWYLAGPMTGYPQFNFPAFYAAAANLRAASVLVISPAELDESTDTAEKAMESDDGNLAESGITETWGDLLARDVKLIADQVTGIIFLDGWEKSRGARLEAFVGLLCGRQFARYVNNAKVDYLEGMSALTVLTKLVRVTHFEVANNG